MSVKSEGYLRNSAIFQKGVMQNLATNSGQGQSQYSYQLGAIDSAPPTPTTRPAKSESPF